MSSPPSGFPPIPGQPPKPIECGIVAAPPPEVAANLNPQQLANVVAYAQIEAEKAVYAALLHRAAEQWQEASAEYTPSEGT